MERLGDGRTVTSGMFSGWKRQESWTDANVLCNDARQWLRSCEGQQDLDFENSKEREVEETERVIKLKGIELSSYAQLGITLLKEC